MVMHLLHMFTTLRDSCNTWTSRGVKEVLSLKDVQIWKKDEYDVASGMNYGVASSLSSLRFIYKCKTDKHHKNRWVLENYCLFSNTNTLIGRVQVKFLNSHVVGWKSIIHPDTMIGWTISDRGHQHSSVRKVTHLSFILALGNLTSEFPWANMALKMIKWKDGKLERKQIHGTFDNGNT